MAVLHLSLGSLKRFYFILVYGKRRQARAWNAICLYQQQYDNMMAEC